jgi:hypothetical protein
MPVLLRQRKMWYEYVGTCFVLGLMREETAEEVRDRTLFEQEFGIL